MNARIKKIALQEETHYYRESTPVFKAWVARTREGQYFLTIAYRGTEKKVVIEDNSWGLYWQTPKKVVRFDDGKEFLVYAKRNESEEAMVILY